MRIAIMAAGAVGGYFGARLAAEDRLLPETKVDFHLTCGGEPYSIAFSGPLDQDATDVTLGSFEDVRADGKWHHATFDLLGGLQAVLGPE